MTYKALVVEEDAEAISQIMDAMVSLDHHCDAVASQEEALKRLTTIEYDYMLLASKIRARCGNGCRRPRMRRTCWRKWRSYRSRTFLGSSS